MESHCIHRKAGPQGRIVCSSSRFIHTLTLPESFCEVNCAFREQPRSGFFAATSQLSQSRASKPKTKRKCGGCKKSKAPPFKPDLSYSGNGNWTVAVTTAPRTNCTLKQSLDSIVTAGWPDPIVFAEPNSTPTQFQTIQNRTRRGVWHNWLHSVRWILRNTNSEFILTVQDDSLFHPQSREFTESVLWPSDRCGFLSLYTPKHYSIRKDKTERPSGINHIRTSSLWGACALIWHRTVLEQVIRHKVARNWMGVKPKSKQTRTAVMAKRRANPSMIANSDTAIGKILNSMGLKMYFADPSPVSHVAVHSTIGHGGNRGRRNCYRCADHSRSLFDQIPISKAYQRYSMKGPALTGVRQFDEAQARWHRLGYRLSMSVPLQLWQAIRSAVQPGFHTLEFGCGVSTSAFHGANHTALESVKDQARRFRSAQYTPVARNGWYIWEPDRKYDVILVDGPYRGDRTLGAETIAVAAHDHSLVFIDDVEREDGESLVNELTQSHGFHEKLRGRYAVLSKNPSSISGQS